VLPRDWAPGKTWPVVVAVPGAERDFEGHARLFARARGKMPFIVVVPLVLTNGNTRYREIPTYHYADDVWTEVERVGRCRFDEEGLAAVARDVRTRYGGAERYFLTGYEAGGHLVWATVFRHPEALRAAAMSGPNYIGRCMENGRFSDSPARVDLPVRVFEGADSPFWAPGKPFSAQWQNAKRLAEEHGYRGLSFTPVPGQGHRPFPDEVLAYFRSLWKP
jgi:dienelactone hydrolase